ncbi:MAG: PAS domain S-box protein [Clostridiales bacterium]|jgi:PAS domain S-box-containing protein|nr:PAS domain S-box protein [Clostridiales bacterium]
MSRKLWENRSAIFEGVLLFAVFGLNYIIMYQSSTTFVISVSFVITFLFFLFFVVRFNMRVKRIVTRLTREIAKLPDDLSEKHYDVQDETKDFYDELSGAKRKLNETGRMRQELMEIANTVATNMEFDKLLKDLLPKINEATHSMCTAFYSANYSTNKLEIKHSIGFSKNIYGEFDLTLGEGFVGQAAIKNEITIYQDIPDDTLFKIRSFLGEMQPRSILVMPVRGQDSGGVLVCASVKDYTREDRDKIEMIRHYMGIAANNGLSYEQNKRLTNELSFQNKLIQDQHQNMQDKLEEKTQLLSFVVDYFGDGCIFALDTRGIILIWNKGAERVHGISAGNAINRNMERVCEENKWQPISSAFQKALREGSCRAEHIRIDSPSGEELYYDGTMTCIYNSDERRQPIGVLITLQEVPA